MQNSHHTGKLIQPSSAVRSVGQIASIRCLHQNEREDAVMELNKRHDMTKTLYWKPKGELLFSLAFGQTLKQSKNRCIVTWPSLPMGLRFKCSSLTKQFRILASTNVKNVRNDQLMLVILRKHIEVMLQCSGQIISVDTLHLPAILAAGST